MIEVKEGSSTLTKIPKLLEGAKLAFVLGLRRAFSCSLIDKDLQYNVDPALTKIKVWTAFPLRLEFFPSLVVSCGGGDLSTKYLADDFVDESEDGNTVNFAGQLNFTISITVLSKSTLERERILDSLILIIRHLFINELRHTRSPGFNFDLTYSKDIRASSEQIVEIENAPAYSQTVDVPVYLEYQASVDRSALETLRATDVSGIQVIPSVELEQK